MNLIPVGHGRFATVDADDFERLSGLCWHVGADSAARQHFGEFAYLNYPEEPKRPKGDRRAAA